jgi:nitrite reductase/ring-hydroxylating ferredoxin subunit
MRRRRSQLRVVREDGYSQIIERRVVFLVKTGESSVTALDPTCTHLGCRVSWDAEARELRCPCHGGVYDHLGQVKSGPPPAPLPKLSDEDRRRQGLHPGLMKPLNELLDWLDSRTGWRTGRAHLLEEPIQAGVGWWFVTGSILLMLLTGSAHHRCRAGDVLTCRRRSTPTTASLHHGARHVRTRAARPALLRRQLHRRRGR